MRTDLLFQPRGKHSQILMIFKGKSLLLSFILISRLMDKKPTLFQHDDGRFYLFHKKGVFEIKDISLWDRGSFHELVGRHGFGPREETWALIDSSIDQKTPPRFLCHEGSTIFLVQVVSPRTFDAQWTRRRPVWKYVMDEWSWFELAVGYVPFRLPVYPC